MATKLPKRIEDMSEEDLMSKSGAAYDKIMPSPEPGEQKPLKKAKGGMIGSASRRADGIAQRGKTRGKVM